MFYNSITLQHLDKQKSCEEELMDKLPVDIPKNSLYKLKLFCTKVHSHNEGERIFLLYCLSSPYCSFVAAGNAKLQFDCCCVTDNLSVEFGLKGLLMDSRMQINLWWGGGISSKTSNGSFLWKNNINPCERMWNKS